MKSASQKFLILDTCGGEGGVAFAAANNAADLPQVIASRVLPGRSFASAVVIAVREVLAEAGIALAELDAIVVMHGPGSFTGIRVGLSAAKGLAHASGVRVIALSRLAVMAARASTENLSGTTPIFLAMDAGRGEFYFGAYRDAGATCELEALLTLDALRQRVQTAKVFVYEASAREKLAGAVEVVMMRPPTAADCIALAVRAFAAGEFASLAELDANYLRSAAAAPKQPKTPAPEPAK